MGIYEKMGKLLKNIKAMPRRKKAAAIILWIYLWILYVFQAISNDIEMTIVFFVFLGVVSFVSSFAVMYLLGDKAAQINIEAARDNQRINILWGVVIGIITLGGFLIYFLGQYPGGFSSDSNWQYEQGLGVRPYNDWHPVLHTILFFTLPLKTGHSLALIVFLQLLYFALVFGYLGYVLYKNGCPGIFLGLLCTFVWINPFITGCIMYPWKDIGLTIFAVLLIGYYIQIVCSKGEWLSKKSNLILFCLITVVCGYMRHNAVLFVAPLVFIVLFYTVKNWKKRLILLGVIAVFFLSVKMLYAVLDVETPDKRIVETAGLPATILCNVMKESPGDLPKETQQVMYSLATKEAYENIYVTGSFNSIKWKEFDSQAFDKLSYGAILKYTAECFYYAPKASLRALTKLTDTVWAIDGKDGNIRVEVVDNSWWIKPNPVPKLEIFVNQMQSFFMEGAGRILFGALGCELLCMLVVAAIVFSKGQLSWIHAIPLFCYDYGTMLLLSGPDWRFFLLNLPLWLPIVFLMLKDKNVEMGSEKGNTEEEEFW